MDESMYDMLVEQGFTEADIERLMELGVLSQEQDILDRQRKQAELLQATPGARGRFAGRVYKAANPLEHAGVALQRIRGSQQLAGLPGQERDLAQEQMRRRIEYLMAGRRNPGAAAAPTSVAMAPPIGRGIPS